MWTNCQACWISLIELPPCGSREAPDLLEIRETPGREASNHLSTVHTSRAQPTQVLSSASPPLRQGACRKGTLKFRVSAAFSPFCPAWRDRNQCLHCPHILIYPRRKVPSAALQNNRATFAVPSNLQSRRPDREQS